MAEMPNTWTMIPDVSYVASTIDLTDDDDFESIDPGMQPDYMAAVWTGVLVVETPGECLLQASVDLTVWLEAEVFFASPFYFASNAQGSTPSP